MRLFALWLKEEFSSALSQHRAFVIASEYYLGGVKLGSFGRVMKALYVVMWRGIMSRTSLQR
jgi:hypothetical protein